MEWEWIFLVFWWRFLWSACRDDIHYRFTPMSHGAFFQMWLHPNPPIHQIIWVQGRNSQGEAGGSGAVLWTIWNLRSCFVFGCQSMIYESEKIFGCLAVYCNWEGCNQKSEMLLPKWKPLKWLDSRGWTIFWSKVDINDESLIFRLLTHIDNKRKVCRPDILQLHQLFCAKQIPHESASLGLSSYSIILVLRFNSSNLTCFQKRDMFRTHDT